MCIAAVWCIQSMYVINLRGCLVIISVYCDVVDGVLGSWFHVSIQCKASSSCVAGQTTSESATKYIRASSLTLT